MTRETVEWLLWLVGCQSVQIGADDSREQAMRAWAAMAELEAARAAVIAAGEGL